MPRPHTLRIPACHMRGGTSKGVFFCLHDLPAPCQVPGPARDALMLRLMGSPDPYGQQIDGLGGATSSTSKVVILSRSTRPGHDVDYLFGQVAIDRPLVDWSGNCGNLSAAVGPFAIASGLVPAAQVPHDGHCRVRIWQANTARTIIAHVPMAGGQVQEAGDFELDGVAFASAEVALQFLQPGGATSVLPTGQVVDTLTVPGLGELQATLIDAGIPTVFVDAAALGLAGTEGPALHVNTMALATLEAVRAQAALRMGLIADVAEAARRPHTPKLAWVAPATGYVAANGRAIAASEVDLLVRALSMGRLHHAMMGTVAVAIATAAAIPGTLVHRAAGRRAGSNLRFGHPSGTLRVGADVRQEGGHWVVDQVSLSRSARVLMQGHVHVPGDGFC